MKIAYLLSAQQRPSHLARMIHRLNAKDAWFFIHVDAQVNIAPFQNALNGIPPSKITFTKREVTRWGGINVVQATLNNLSACLKHPENLQFAITLSEECYPIKSSTFIDDFLSHNDQKIFLHHHPLREKEREQIEHYHFMSKKPRKFPPSVWPTTFHEKILNRLLALGHPLPRLFPSYLKPFSGSPSWGFPRYAAEYIFSFIQNHPDYIKFHRYTGIPEEIFFQTILLNAANDKISQNIIKGDLKYTDWTKPNVPLPAVLTVEDFEAITHSGQLFARRFDASVDSRILAMLDEHAQ